MTIDEETQKYIDYIDRQHKRKSELSRAQGISFWVVCSATVYLASFLIFQLKDISNYLPVCFLLFFYSHYACYFMIPLLKMKKPTLSSSNFDYRIPNQQFDMGRAIRATVFMFFPYFLLVLFPKSELGMLLPSGSLQSYVVYLIFWFFVFVTFAIFVSLIIAQFKFKSGYPDYGVSIRNKGGIVNIFSNVLNLMLLGVVVLIVYSFFSLSQTLWDSLAENRNIFSIVLIQALGFSLLIFLIQKCLDLHSDSDEVNVLNKLDRDIVLYGIDSREIKNRIESEILKEIELGSWIQNKLEELNENAKNLKLKFSHSTDVRSQIDKIDKAYSIERAGRENAYWQGLRGDTKSFVKDAKKMNSWLEDLNLKARIMNDDVFKNLIYAKTKNLSDLIIEVELCLDKALAEFESSNK